MKLVGLSSIAAVVAHATAIAPRPEAPALAALFAPVNATVTEGAVVDRLGQRFAGLRKRAGRDNRGRLRAHARKRNSNQSGRRTQEFQTHRDLHSGRRSGDRKPAAASIDLPRSSKHRTVRDDNSVCDGHKGRSDFD